LNTQARDISPDRGNHEISVTGKIPLPSGIRVPLRQLVTREFLRGAGSSLVSRALCLPVDHRQAKYPPPCAATLLPEEACGDGPDWNDLRASVGAAGRRHLTGWGHCSLADVARLGCRDRASWSRLEKRVHRDELTHNRSPIRGRSSGNRPLRRSRQGDSGPLGRGVVSDARWDSEVDALPAVDAGRWRSGCEPTRSQICRWM
jgi:hypothetical protein